MRLERAKERERERKSACKGSKGKKGEKKEGDSFHSLERGELNFFPSMREKERNGNVYD